MRLKGVYQSLFKKYGRQKWWPADSRFEVMVGAILTQNTAWLNVERALNNLKQATALSPKVIIETNHDVLAQWLKPSGYFNIKAERLKQFCHWYLEHDSYDGLKYKRTARLREMLLSVKGVGPETADDILLYAFNRKVFVVDAYTRRLFSRLGFVEESIDYESLRAVFENELHAETVKIFNEYHALIVMQGKEVCKTRPLCNECCLQTKCKKLGVVT
ncbi:MAG: endonuclease [Sulfuriflexus sp.]|nr:endonuclease [Sulfuriflexus sp.]